MEDFIKKYKHLFSIKAIQDEAGIKGNLLHKVIGNEQYRNLQPEHIEGLEKLFLPVYQGLKEVFEKKS